MSNDNLDNDVLATAEMLKMFENIDSDVSSQAEQQPLKDPDFSALDVDISHQLSQDMVNLDNHFEDELDALSEMDLGNTSDAEILEVAGDFAPSQTPELLTNLNSPEDLNELSLESELTPLVEQSSDEDFPIADLDETLDHEMSLVETNEDDALELMDAAPSIQPLSKPEPLTDNNHSQTIHETDTNPISLHLQAVVANAIQALQDWMQLRQEGESKGPQQSLAQLDVLLDTVTTQQQQLADQLANSSHQQLVQLSSALGVSLATPQTLGWTKDDWRIKAQQVSDKTDDISQRNAKLRQELERL